MEIWKIPGCAKSQEIHGFLLRAYSRQAIFCVYSVHRTAYLTLYMWLMMKYNRKARFFTN